MPPDPASHARLASLDQFRGYTVAGMFLVNFLGGFAITPALLKHHNSYCSYADTIMPQFLFAVGFAFRLTFSRRLEAQGTMATYRRVGRRLGGLLLLSIALYTLAVDSGQWAQMAKRGFWSTLGELGKRHWFQTLLHIAVTSLWILPVIRAGALVRLGWLLGSAGAHVVLSHGFNFAWVNTPPHGIDGGPLGFLTWTIPALVGTFACDAVLRAAPSVRPAPMLLWAVMLMILGYGLSCGTRLYDRPVSANKPLVKLAKSPVVPPLDRIDDQRLTFLLAEPPFVPPPDSAQRPWNYWMMSQRSGSLSYQTFAAGFALAVFALFWVACDRLGWRLGLFGTLGTNALAAYILGGMVELAVKHYIPRDAAAWHVASGFVLFFSGAYLLIWLLQRKGLMLRL